MCVLMLVFIFKTRVDAHLITAQRLLRDRRIRSPAGTAVPTGVILRALYSKTTVNMHM